MAHLWEPLRAHHKPLIAYIISEAAAIVSSILVRLMGFKKAKHGSITSWTRQPKQQNIKDTNSLKARAPAGPMQHAMHAVEVFENEVLNATVSATGTSAAAATSLQYRTGRKENEENTFENSSFATSHATSITTTTPSLPTSGTQHHHSRHDQSPVPIVFIHGLGLGVLPYILFVSCIY